MKIISKKTTRRGFVVEETLEGCLPGCEKEPMGAYTDESMGIKEFNDLTEGMKPGQHGGWDEFDQGQCPKCGATVKYRQMLVVTHIVRETEAL